MFDPQTKYDINFDSIPIRDFHDYKDLSILQGKLKRGCGCGDVEKEKIKHYAY